MNADRTTYNLCKIADHYGYEHQSMKTIEECAELIKAIADDDPEEIIEEMADVQIMIWQMTRLMSCSGQLDDEIVFKIDRQLKRMEEGDGDGL
ncbi:MAG: hypothetical protein LUD72_07190 [Bacteroidales bacterium]|nr:hypothetical protein [Bacteroidales bacterium]